MGKLKTGFRRAWRWISHDFFKASALLFALSLVGSIVNMLCRIMLGRLLTSEQYGEMETMMQISVYVSVPVAAVQMVVARQVAFAKGEGRTDRIGDIIWVVGRQMGMYALATVVLILGAAPFIRDFFHLNSIWPIVATSGIVLSVFMISVISGALQGGHRFWQGGVSALFGPVSRIGLSWALIRPGFGATGALAAHAGSSMIMSVAGLAFAWDLIRKRAREPVNLRGMYRFLVPAMMTLWLTGVIGGIDIIIVKRLFSTWVAGDYMRVSAVVRLSLFVNGALTLALFPWVASEQAGGRQTIHLLVKASAAGLGVGVAAALLFSVFPGFVLSIFYRDIPPHMLAWLRLLGWALIPVGVFNVLIQYHMARQEYRFLFRLAPAIAAYAGLLILFRQSIPALIMAMGGGALGVVLCLLLPVWLNRNAAPSDRERACAREA